MIAARAFKINQPPGSGAFCDGPLRPRPAGRPDHRLIAVPAVPVRRRTPGAGRGSAVDRGPGAHAFAGPPLGRRAWLQPEGRRRPAGHRRHRPQDRRAVEAGGRAQLRRPGSGQGRPSARHPGGRRAGLQARPAGVVDHAVTTGCGRRLGGAAQAAGPAGRRRRSQCCVLSLVHAEENREERQVAPRRIGARMPNPARARVGAPQFSGSNVVPAP